MEGRGYERIPDKSAVHDESDEEKKQDVEVTPKHCLDKLVKAFNAWARELSCSHSLHQIEDSGESKALEECKSLEEVERIPPGAASFEKMLQAGLQLIQLLKKEKRQNIDKAMTAFISMLKEKIEIIDEHTQSSIASQPSPATIQLTTSQFSRLRQQFFYQRTTMSAQLDSGHLPADYTINLRRRLIENPHKPIVIADDTEQLFRQGVYKLFQDIILLLHLFEHAIAQDTPVKAYSLQDLFFKYFQQDLYHERLNIFAGLDRVIELTETGEIFPTQTLSQKLVSLRELLKNYNKKYGTDPNTARIMDTLSRETIDLIEHAYQQQLSPQNKEMGAKTYDIYQEANDYQERWSIYSRFLMSDTDKMRLVKAIAAIALGILIWSLGMTILSVIASYICSHFYSISILHFCSVLWHQAEAGIVMQTVTGVLTPAFVSASGFFGYRKFRYYGHLNSPIGQALTAVAEEVSNLSVVQQEHKA